MPKIELNIIDQHLPNRDAIPKTIIWEDGLRFPIDKVLNRCTQVWWGRYSLYMPNL